MGCDVPHGTRTPGARNSPMHAACPRVGSLCACWWTGRSVLRRTRGTFPTWAKFFKISPWYLWSLSRCSPVRIGNVKVSIFESLVGHVQQHMEFEEPELAFAGALECVLHAKDEFNDITMEFLGNTKKVWNIHQEIWNTICVLWNIHWEIWSTVFECPTSTDFSSGKSRSRSRWSAK